MISLQQDLLLFAAAVAAGAVNSVAGGGTLLTFPALIGSGFLANVANATSTVALWPGQLSSLWGYRREIGQSRSAILLLGIPSLIGGGLGAFLFSRTSSALFARLVPFLIFTATLLFMAQGPISRRLKAGAVTREGGTKAVGPFSQFGPVWPAVALFQFLVAIYGGYFGAGIGILMLAALGFMGFTDIHRMNGLKNINGLLINAVAIGIFIVARTAPGQGTGTGHDRLVDWSAAALMAAGSIVGGYSGAGIARRIGQQNVRRIVIAIGFALTLSLLRKSPPLSPIQRIKRHTSVSFPSR